MNIMDPGGRNAMAPMCIQRNRWRSGEEGFEYAGTAEECDYGGDPGGMRRPPPETATPEDLDALLYDLKSELSNKKFSKDCLDLLATLPNYRADKKDAAVVGQYSMQMALAEMTFQNGTVEPYGSMPVADLFKNMAPAYYAAAQEAFAGQKLNSTDGVLGGFATQLLGPTVFYDPAAVRVVQNNRDFLKGALLDEMLHIFGYDQAAIDSLGKGALETKCVKQ